MRTTFALAITLLLAPAPAFAKQPAASAAAARTRFFELEGGRNFRDIGGYRTADGRTVRWNMLYRSGSLGNLSPAAQQRLAALGTVAIIDLRSDGERMHDNGPWLAAMPGYWTRRYDISQGDMARHFSQPGAMEPANIRAMMQGGYRSLPKEQSASYKVLFARLLAGNGPVVVNCTAGKDRTGIATALVLTALGVPYAKVREDYLLSNNAPGMNTLSSALPGPLGKLPPESARLLAGVEGSYLDTAFAAMRKDYGSVDGFLRKELGIGAKEKAALRKRMLAGRR